MKEKWQEQLCNLPTETVRACLLCGGTTGQNDARWRAFLGLIDPYDVQRCPQCGLRWLSPRPNACGYRDLYSSAMYFGGEGASPVDYQCEARGRVDYWRSRIRTAAKIVTHGRSIVSFFDYGAATGEFVRIAREEGHACVGLELSADARAVARERNAVSLLSPDQMAEVDKMQFDVIHMNHVLEHMPDPLAHLRWCANRLNPQGLLVLEVPQQFDNDLDRLRRCLHVGGKRQQFDAYSLHHTYFFNPKTMTELLRLAGFQVSSITTFNYNKTPLWPPKLKNWILRPFLGCANRLHLGGNIIEVYAKRA